MYVGRNLHMDLLSPHGGHTLDYPFNIPSSSESASPCHCWESSSGRRTGAT